MNNSYSRLTRLNRFLFQKYPINWPLNEKLTIITGVNESGKTLLLESMSDYFIEQQEKVLYFPVDRILNTDFFNFKMVWDKLDSLNVMSQLSDVGQDYNFTKKWGINLSALEMYLKTRQYNYIDTGLCQAINFVVNIMNYGDDIIVMIDMPEKNLDMYKKKSIIDDLLHLPNVKKLIAVTHSPEIISRHMPYAWDISELCNILETTKER